jgi:hypothetical protein
MPPGMWCDAGFRGTGSGHVGKGREGRTARSREDVEVVVGAGAIRHLHLLVGMAHKRAGKVGLGRQLAEDGGHRKGGLGKQGMGRSCGKTCHAVALEGVCGREQRCHYCRSCTWEVGVEGQGDVALGLTHCVLLVA